MKKKVAIPGRRVRCEGAYTAFIPAPLPPKLEWTSSLVSALSEADRLIGRLAGEGYGLPNPHLLIRPFVAREAVLSSRIEGTQARAIEPDHRSGLDSIPRPTFQAALGSARKRFCGLRKFKRPRRACLPVRCTQTGSSGVETLYGRALARFSVSYWVASKLADAKRLWSACALAQLSMPGPAPASAGRRRRAASCGAGPAA